MNSCCASASVGKPNTPASRSGKPIRPMVSLEMLVSYSIGGEFSVSEILVGQPFDDFARRAVSHQRWLISARMMKRPANAALCLHQFRAPAHPAGNVPSSVQRVALQHLVGRGPCGDEQIPVQC